MRRLALIVCLLSLSRIVLAESLAAGTWIQRSSSSPNTPRLVMIIEEVGSGRRITYKALLPDGKMSDRTVMTILTALDGKDAPVLVDGKPSGETMAIRQIDGHHSFTVIKMQGKEFGTSKAELSADGKVLKVENEMADARGTQDGGKRIEYWDKK
jgi:hypothetical protein